jgi:mannose-6-phosphate isomerase-like protein (cupin superfamily)
MTHKTNPSEPTFSAIPADDLQRHLTKVNGETDSSVPHVALVGNVNTILLTGKDTAGRFCLIDLYIPPGGGPPPHRHDFEETFTLLEGELDVVFRGTKQVMYAGETINVPANAPHQFRNSSSRPARMLCIASPPGLEEFFFEIGIPVATRTTIPPALDEAALSEFRAKSARLAPKYRIEQLPHA